MLHTPNVMDSLAVRSPEAMKRQMENNRPGRTQPPTLREQIGLLGTPTAEPRRRTEKFRTGRTPNMVEAMSMLPTPEASYTGGDSANTVTMENGRFVRTSKRTGTRFGASLRDSMMAIPTPIATDHKGCGTNNTVRDRLDYTVGKTPDGENTGMKLQPAFVEWMMGYPIGYTDLKPSETA
jgi:hypothetical protein